MLAFHDQGILYVAISVWMRRFVVRPLMPPNNKCNSGFLLASTAVVFKSVTVSWPYVLPGNPKSARIAATIRVFTVISGWRDGTCLGLLLSHGGNRNKLVRARSVAVRVIQLVWKRKTKEVP